MKNDIRDCREKKEAELEKLDKNIKNYKNSIEFEKFMIKEWRKRKKKLKKEK
jgi:hypothetical protein